MHQKEKKKSKNYLEPLKIPNGIKTTDMTVKLDIIRCHQEKRIILMDLVHLLKRRSLKRRYSSYGT